MKEKRSAAWSYFKILDYAKAQCLFCNHVLCYRAGGISNLKKHLMRQHSIYLSKHPEPKPEQLNFNPTDNKVMQSFENPPGPSQYGAGNTSNNINPFPMAIKEESISSPPPTPITYTNVNSNFDSNPSDSSFEERSLITTTSTMNPTSNRNTEARLAREKFLNKSLFNMFIKDLQPFSMVSDYGFREFINVLDPDFQIPSYYTITNQWLPEMYHTRVQEIKDLLSNVEHLSLALDFWSSNISNFLSVTVYYISDEWEIKTFLLDTIWLPEEDVTQIADSLSQITNKWEITLKVYAVVSNNINLKSDNIGLYQWKYMTCFATILNIILQKAFRFLETIHNTVKSLVNKLKCSQHAINRLQLEQQQLNQNSDPIKLYIDKENDWRSTYKMFENVIVLQNSIEKVNQEFNISTLTIDDWTNLKSICKILRLFIQVSNEFCGKSVKVSKIIVLERGIINALHKFRSTIEISTLSDASNFIDSIIYDLNNAFEKIEQNDILAQATFLDPRFKKNGFTSNSVIEKCRKNLMKEIHELINLDTEINDPNQDTRNNIRPQPTTSQSTEIKLSDCIWEDFDSRVEHTVKLTTSVAISEITQYEEEPNIERSADPLQWWKYKSLFYPNLAKIAKQKLSAVATSIEPERFMTEEGKQFFERRKSLKEKFLDQVLFLHCNDEI